MFLKKFFHKLKNHVGDTYVIFGRSSVGQNIRGPLWFFRTLAEMEGGELPRVPPPLDNIAIKSFQYKLPEF